MMPDDYHTDAAAVPVPDTGDDTLRELHEQLARKLADEEALRMGQLPYADTSWCCVRDKWLRRADALLPLIREHTAAAVQGERERLSHERDTWRDRANRAAAQIAHVRTLHGPCNDGCPNCHECALAEPCPTIRALDGTEVTS